jgi:hypothetical protein
MKQALLSTLLALASAAAWAQTLTWSVEPRGVAIAADAAENVYTVDGDANPAGDITLTKTSPQGVWLFTVKHDNTDATRHELPSGVDTDSLGGAYVSGTVRSGFSNPVNAHAVLMRFAADGALRWRVVLGSDFDGGSSFRVLRDAADNAYVLGLGPTPAGVRMRIHKLTPEGVSSVLWTDTAGIGAPTQFKWGLDGTLVVAARSITGQLGGAARIALNGTTLTLSTQTPALSAVDAAADAQGNLYIASIDPALNQGRLQRLSAGFGGSWLRHDTIGMIRVDAVPGGGVIVGGTPNATGFGTAFARYAEDGTQLWANRDADGPQMNMLGHAQMRLDAAGNAYLAGNTLGQMALTRVNADGSSAWARSVPFGSGVALAFGAGTQAVYLVGGQTARIDQGGAPPTAAAPDLVTTLSQQPAVVFPHANFTLVTTVRNLGNAVATRAMITQSYAGNVIVVLARSTWARCRAFLPMRCPLGDIAPGQSVTVVEFLRSNAPGSVVTTATVTSDTPEPSTQNNTATLTTQVVQP